MAVINADTIGAWQELAVEAAEQYPAVGKTVRVTQGKHSGTVGRVTWHGRDRYANWRTCTDAQAHLRDLQGRWGFRVRVQTDSESFFVAADQVEVVA